MPKFRTRLFQLLWGLYDGRSALEIEWVRARSGKVPWLAKSLGWIHPRRISFGPDREFRIIDALYSTSYFPPVGEALRDYPFKFIEFRSHLFCEYPEREGLGPRCLYWTFFKRFAKREQLILLELFGKPWRIVEWDKDAQIQKEELPLVDRQVANLGGAQSARLPRGAKLNIAFPGEKSGETHKDVERDSDQQISKLVLGNTNTTDAQPGQGMNSRAGRRPPGSAAARPPARRRRHRGGHRRPADGRDRHSQLRRRQPEVRAAVRPSRRPRHRQGRRARPARQGADRRASHRGERGVRARRLPHPRRQGAGAAGDGGADGRGRCGQSYCARHHCVSAGRRAGAGRGADPAGRRWTAAARPGGAGRPESRGLDDDNELEDDADPAADVKATRLTFAKQPDTVNGSPETLIDKAVRESARATSKWIDAIATAVDGRDDAGAILRVLKAIPARLNIQPFARAAERRMMHGVMLGALDSVWERENEQTIAPAKFAQTVLPVGPGAEPSFSVKPYEQAVKWFKSKNVVDKATFESMSSRAKQRAFTIAGEQRDALLRTVHQELARQVAEGADLRQFKTFMKQRLESAGWTPSNPSHVETIYRTNVMNAYSAGRHAEMTQPAVLKARPYWQILGVNDARTRDTHRRVQGLCIPASDAAWHRAYPPFGFNCRDRVVSRSETEVQKLGLRIGSGADLANLPDEGFESGIHSLL
jgi:SPP1 gp7 family putative phage head morphogenesis protein